MCEVQRTLDGDLGNRRTVYLLRTHRLWLAQREAKYAACWIGVTTQPGQVTCTSRHNRRHAAAQRLERT